MLTSGSTFLIYSSPKEEREKSEKVKCVNRPSVCQMLEQLCTSLVVKAELYLKATLLKGATLHLVHLLMGILDLAHLHGSTCIPDRNDVLLSLFYSIQSGIILSASAHRQPCRPDRANH